MAIHNDTLDSWDDPDDEFTKALEEEGFWDELDDDEIGAWDDGGEVFYADDDW